MSMRMVTCSQCGRKVSSMAYTCPNCGLDVRALRDSGHSCGDCEFYNEGDGDYCEIDTPGGCPCLQWEKVDYSD